MEKIILNTDILVSIGNAVSNSLPSKVIDYIAYGKPIIHFSSQKNDVCKNYFDKYPLALVIDESAPVNHACDLIKEFIAENKGKKVSYDTISKIFYRNEPQYSANMIMEND